MTYTVEITDEGLDKLVLATMKDLVADPEWVDDNVVEAAKVMITWFGMPGKDFVPEDSEDA